MTKRSYGRAVKLAVAILAATAASALAAAAAGATEIIYNDRPATLPGNFASLGYECCQVSEFGGQVGFPAKTARRNPTVEVVMSSWACQQGGAEDNTCKKTSAAKFKEEVTLNVYEAVGNMVGAKVGSQTRTFEMPYRPSASPKCTTGGGKGGWYDAAEATCYHGKAFPIIFKLTGADALPAPKNVFVLPESNAIVSLAYNTSDYGAKPQRPQPCNSESQGCPYDSLNVAVTSAPATPPSVGTWPEKEEVFIASTYSALFCPPATASGNFEPSGKCWNEEQPVIKVKAT